MTSLALNQIVRMSVSTYNWPLDDDNIWYIAEENLKEIYNWAKLTLEKDWEEFKVDRWDVDIDVCYDDRWKIREDLAQAFKENIEACVKKWDITLADRLKKYGLLYHGMNFYMPHYYNYEDDELWIVLTEDMLEDDDLPPRQVVHPELVPVVQKYIDEVRVSSYDGYHSFEPTNVDSVGRLDYVYLWAILTYEWIYDDIKQGIEYAYEDCDEILYEHSEIKYLYHYYIWEIRKCDYYVIDWDRLKFEKELR